MALTLYSLPFILIFLALCLNLSIHFPISDKVEILPSTVNSFVTNDIVNNLNKDDEDFDVSIDDEEKDNLDEEVKENNLSNN